MKYLLLLLLSFNLYADEASDAEDLRLQAITDQLATINIIGNTYESQTIIAKLLKKCSIDFNSAFYYKQLFLVGSTDNLNCFLGKKSEVDADDVTKAEKKLAKKNKNTSLDNYDCTTVKDDYAKLLCEARK